MIYRIDFIDNTNFTVQHSLSLADGLDKIKINADKIAGTSYFAKEPRRIEFECFKDTWIEEYILSGDYELDRYVSQFFIRLYENDILVFHGIIDTSFVSYNAKTEVVNFTCYDYLKLISKCSEIKMIYALVQGYHPGYCFGYMMQGVEILLGVTLSHIWGSGWTPLNIQKTALQILSFEWRNIISSFDSWNGELIIEAGFLTYNMHVPEFRLLIYKDHHQWEHRQIKVYGRRYRIYNHICFYQITDSDINEKTSSYDEDDIDELEAERLEICSDYYTSMSWIGNDTLNIDGRSYSFVINPEDLPTNGSQNVTETKYLEFTGNAIPYNIYPKGFYENGGEGTERLKVLKAVLMLHNLTLVSDQYGTIRMVNKNDSSNNTVAIDSADVVEFKVKRLNRSIPDVSTLDILLGDTAILKSIVSEYYIDFFSQIWELTVTIDNLSKYQLLLFYQIQITGILYRITEIQRDAKADEYKIKAWEF